VLINRVVKAMNKSLEHTQQRAPCVSYHSTGACDYGDECILSHEPLTHDSCYQRLCTLVSTTYSNLTSTVSITLLIPIISTRPALLTEVARMASTTTVQLRCWHTGFATRLYLVATVLRHYTGGPCESRANHIQG
jgi:hypothetical protein